MAFIENASIDLVVTSPPYPMIAMWDEIFCNENSSIRTLLEKGQGMSAFEAMHQILDQTWTECARVVKEGGFVCINIGDATRSFGGDFQLFSNHARIIQKFTSIGFSNLPNIIWRKQTNAPNKFMGSGMLPAGAYITLEHEFILIFRKGSKRSFSAETKQTRNESAYFWEERNRWFSDVWDFKGTRQLLTEKTNRKRSAAYPLELPYRLIQMYSVQGDNVLDPFLGTGTTTLAAMISRRNSDGIEIDTSLRATIKSFLEEENCKLLSVDLHKKRISDHIKFIEKRQQDHPEKIIKHSHQFYQFPVITKQETRMQFYSINGILQKKDSWDVHYEPLIDAFK